MLIVVLISYFTQVTSEGIETVVFNGKKYTVVKDTPKNPDCKGSEVLKDDMGNEFCVAKMTDPQSSHLFEEDRSKYAECGRENLPEESNARIIFGKPVQGVRYPWLAKLKTFDGGKCTGTIISKRAILTASHCKGNNKVEATVGVHDISNASRSDVYRGQVIKHPNYTMNSGIYDVAVVILERDLEFSKNVGPICLPGKEEIGQIKDGTLFNAIGYGIKVNFHSILFKYGILQTEQQVLNQSSILQFQMILFDTLAELIPDIQEIIEGQDKSLRIMGSKELKSFAKQNLEKLETTMIMKISDPDDQVSFRKLYPKLIKLLPALEGILDNRLIFNKEQLLTKKQMLILGEFRDQANKIFILPRVAQYALYRVKEYDEPWQEFYNFTLRAIPTGEGDLCSGDSGGAAAFKINGKFYIGGITKHVLSPNQKAFLFNDLCYSKDANNTVPLINWPARFERIEPHLAWINDVLDKMDALPKGA